jgi:hypothetical protein
MSVEAGSGKPAVLIIGGLGTLTHIDIRPLGDI